MERVVVQDHQVLVLAAGETVADRSNAKGHLFEEFVALLLHEYGYEAPTTSDLNITADGIEIDVNATNLISRQVAVVECKSYTSNVKAQACTSFLGKLQLARYEGDPNVFGYFFAIPRLVAQGEEVARKAAANDKLFRYFNVGDIVKLLRGRGLIADLSQITRRAPSHSDPAIIVAEDGIFSCAKLLNSDSHRADSIIVWSAAGAKVPGRVVSLLKGDSYAAGLPINTLPDLDRSVSPEDREDGSPVTIVRVRGSSADFEYQLPASPEYFVGRGSTVQDLQAFVRQRGGTLVLNAQSGWGKSSLALQLQRIVEDRQGYSIVVDSRTATNPRFVSEVLREAAHEAQERGLVELPEDSSWASLASSIWTLRRSSWTADGRPIMVFFDQFENVFQDENITREFRDLALMVPDSQIPLMVGFAWKTDLVAWTESHPYRLRDEIRSNSTFISVGPMGAREVDTLLRRLEKRLGTGLSRDLRQRIREYSQGLPWLFKKLSVHIIRELETHQKSQEQLVSEALNVQSLFDSDLAGLSPMETDALRHIARFAPVPAVDVIEKYNGAAIQSLLDSRLVVAVAEKLDTYWDTFRDFLNTGRVPIEDSYIVRQTPRAVAELIFAVLELGGDVTVADLAVQLNVSTKVIYNRSREPRLFGITAYEPNRVKILDDVMNADSIDLEIRRRVAAALRRNRAYSSFVGLSERDGNGVAVGAYARELTNAFPAVAAQAQSWLGYARCFALWFDYAGLSIFEDDRLYLPPDGHVPNGSLRAQQSPRRQGSAFVLRTPKPAFELLAELANSPIALSDASSWGRAKRNAMRELTMLRIASEGNGTLHISSNIIGADGKINPGSIVNALGSIPGGSAALDLLRRDPGVSNHDLGLLMCAGNDAEWGEATIFKAGKDFRGWVKRAGVDVVRARPVVEPPAEGTTLF
ncbi:restriction endonuclease [Streptomyces sp. MJM8645]|uniref:nSTAND1 domain-containing NTPase n=1 Tax=Streptomycetaceae TaxID=2062 RepID=UPI0009A0498D|nr:restriction endonuclease [Streptomyces sp. MJM8645]